MLTEGMGEISGGGRVRHVITRRRWTNKLNDVLREVAAPWVEPNKTMSSENITRVCNEYNTLTGDDRTPTAIRHQLSNLKIIETRRLAAVFEEAPGAAREDRDAPGEVTALVHEIIDARMGAAIEHIANLVFQRVRADLLRR